MSPSGSIGKYVRARSGRHVSDQAAHEQRAALPWEFFLHLFDAILRPLASQRAHPDAFYQGLRLIAVDGTQWSLRNTEAITAVMPPRHRNQKGPTAAFHKLQTTLLVELATHQPLAAACQQIHDQEAPPTQGQGEITLAKELLGSLGNLGPSLLIADRLYGGSGFIAAVREQSGGQSEVLVRVSDQKSATVVEVLDDGSAIIEVKVSDSRGKPTAQVLRLREIRAEVKPKEQEPGSTQSALQLRLWTSLLDATQAPAAEVARLYAQRWEAELFFAELKKHVGREKLLRAGTIQGAQAEFGALVVAAAVLAEHRVAAGEQMGVQPLRVSVTKISQAILSIMPVIIVGKGIITARQQEQLIERWRKQLHREAKIPPRRSRQCERGLRKPASHWPSIRQRSKQPATWLCSVNPIPLP